MDPTTLTNPPIPTQDTLNQAQADKLAASLKAAGIGLGANYANYKANAPGGPLAQSAIRNLFTGTQAAPTATGPASVRVTKGTVYTAFLPAPYGYVPPEVYGLHPSFTEKAIGGRIPGGASLGFRGSDARVAVYEAKERVASILRKIEGYRGPVAQGFAEGNKFTEPLPGLTLEDYIYLRSLPDGSTRAKFYVNQYAPKYEALIRELENNALAQFAAAREAGLKAQAEFLAELEKRTARAPGPQFDGTASAGGGGDYGADPRVEKLTGGFALRLIAAKLSMDP